ncbi:MAG: protein DpdD, partial [Planctomycetota bacterium]|nr:protein DpdD [Planctomycetota bacterium]
MNPADFSADQLDFLSRFFGPGNKLRWDAFWDGSMSEQTRQKLSPFIDDLRQPDTATLLPHVGESSPALTTWYGLAGDARQARALKEQLMAFVGPTWTDFTGQQATLDDRDPIEAAVKQYFAPHVFRLRVLQPEDRQGVHQQFERLRDLRDRHPDRTSQPVRPVGRILRDLEMAILVRNETTARECLDALRLRGRLSAHNLAFLNVRILAAFERWSVLRTLPTYRPLFDNRRPARVTEALIQCVYDEHFAKFEYEGNLADCIAKFIDKESSFGTLFRTRGPLNDPVVVKAWLLRAVSRADHDQAQSLLNEIPGDHPDRRWAEALAGYLKRVAPEPVSAEHAPVEPVATPSQLAIDQARQALASDNFDAAFELLLQCEPTVDVIRQLIICADEINTLTATRQALAVIEAASADVREQALSRRAIARAWEHLTELVTDDQTPSECIELPDSWLAWLHLLNTTGPWPNAVEIAQQGCLEWPINPLRSNPSLIEQIADQLIASRSPDATAIVRTILPDLLRCFLPEDEALREFKPIYMSLIYLLALDDAISGDDLTALETLAEAVLESAPSTSGPTGSNEYVDLLESIETAWQQVRAFRHLDW